MKFVNPQKIINLWAHSYKLLNITKKIVKIVDFLKFFDNLGIL